MNFNTTEINTLIQSRRSIFPRDYTGERVSDEIVNQMLENANWAPTHKFTEPWRFFVFSGDGIKKLVEFQAQCYKEVTTAKGTFKEDRYTGMLTIPTSSHIIAIGMKRDPNKGIPEVEEVGAVFCAFQNMQLTATAYGVGCYLSTGGVTFFEEAKTFFNLGSDDKLLGFMHIGVPKGAVPAGRRKPIEEKVKWVR